MIKLIINFIQSSFTRLLGLILSFVMVFTIGEFLAPILSSSFFQIHSFVLIVLGISRFGNDDYLLRISSSRNESRFFFDIDKNFIYQSFFTVLLLSITIPFLFKLLISEIIVIIIFGVMYNTVLYISVLFQGSGQYDSASLTFHIFPQLLVILLIIIYDKVSLFDIYSTLLCGLLIGTTIYKFKNRNAARKINFSLPKLFEKKGLGFSALGGIIITNAPIFLSKYHLSPSETIDWAYSIKIVQLCTVLIMLLNFYYSPLIRSAFLSQGKKGVELIFNEQFKISSILIFIIISIFLLSYFFITSKILFVVGTLLPGFLIALFFSSIGYILIMMGQEKINAFLGGLIILYYLFFYLFIESLDIYMFAVVVSFGVVFPKIVSYLYYRIAL